MRHKYQLNLQPDYSVVATIELRPGREGRIQWVGLYEDESWVHSQHPSFREVFSNHLRLASCSYDDLRGLAEVYGYPLEELTEVAKIERAYRVRRASRPIVIKRRTRRKQA